jgi:DNA-binding MarR family transcriptional regulator
MAASIQGSGVVPEKFLERGIKGFMRRVPDRDPEAMAAVWRIARVAGQVEKRLEGEVFRPKHRSWASYKLLYALETFGPSEPGALSTVLDIAPPSVSSLLSTLEKSGLITRRPDPANRRRVIVELTEAGHAAAEEAAGEQGDTAKALMSPLTRDELSTLNGLLDKLLHSYWAAPVIHAAEQIAPML